MQAFCNGYKALQFIIKLHGESSLVSPSASYSFAKKDVISFVSSLHPRSLYEFQPKSFNCYGTTINNKREFLFFSDLLRRLDISSAPVSNIQVSPIQDLRTSLGTSKWFDRLKASIANKILSLEFPVSWEDNMWAQKYIYTYIQAYLDFRYSTNNDLRAPNILGIVVANDHTPLQLAVNAAARDLGYTTIYIQHAEITSEFPALASDIAILSNPHSIKLYKKLDFCSAYVINRSLDHARPCSIIQNNLMKEVDICIYPTFGSFYDRIIDVGRRLLKNKHIRNVYIKLHPREDPALLQQQLSETDIHVIHEIPKAFHLCLVINSSIITQLLELGNVCFTIDNLSPYHNDYYGFTRLGISPRIELSELAKRPFWREFNIRLIQDIYNSCFFASFPSKDSQILSDRLHALVNSKTIIKRAKPSICITKYTDIAKMMGALHAELFLKHPKTTISQHNKHKLYYRELSESENIEYQLQLISTLKSFHASRDIRFYSLLSACSSYDLDQPVYCWLFAMAVQWSHMPISDGIFAKLFSTTSRYKKISTQLYHILVSSLADAAIVVRSEYWSVQYLARFRNAIKTSLAINKLVEIINILPDSFNRAEILKHFTKPRKINKIDALKISSLTHGIEIDRNHAHSVREWSSLCAPYSTLHKFLVQYFEIISLSPYIDAFYNAGIHHHIIEDIKHAIAAQKPYSFIRLSDGEGYLYHGLMFDRSCSSNREQHWWGREIDIKCREELVNDAKRSIESADLLGLPTVYRFIRDSLIIDSGSPDSYTVTQRGLLSLILGLFTGDQTIFAKKLVDQSINHTLFANKQTLVDFIHHARRTVFITSISPETVTEALSLSDLESVSFVQIPTHARSHANKSYISNEAILPDIYPEIREHIRRNARPGDLIFVAAGIAGKGLIHVARTAGAVVIDIGHGLDRICRVHDALVFKSSVNSLPNIRYSNSVTSNSIRLVRHYSAYVTLRKMNIISLSCFPIPRSDSDNSESPGLLLEQFTDLFRRKLYTSAIQVIKDQSLYNISLTSLLDILFALFYSSGNDNSLETNLAFIHANISSLVIDSKSLRRLAVLFKSTHEVKPDVWSKPIEDLNAYSILHFASEIPTLRQYASRSFLLTAHQYIQSIIPDCGINEHNVLQLRQLFHFAFHSNRLDLIGQLLDSLSYHTSQLNPTALRMLSTYNMESLTDDILEKAIKKYSFNNIVLFKLLHQVKNENSNTKALYTSYRDGIIRFALNEADIYFIEALFGVLLSVELDTALQAVIQLSQAIDSYSIRLAKAYVLFTQEYFHEAQSLFLICLEENPGCGLAAKGLRFAFPRTGRNLLDILSLRSKYGYGSMTLGRGGVLKDVAETISIRQFSGEHVDGMNSKQYADHWQHLEYIYGSAKFLNYRSVVQNSTHLPRSIFVIADEGVGDEVRSAQFYSELEKYYTAITITCDPRLLNLLSYSFPNINFYPVKRLRPGIRSHVLGDACRFIAPANSLQKYLTEDCREEMDRSDFVTFGQNLFFSYINGSIIRPKQGTAYIKSSTNSPSNLTHLPKKDLKVGLLWRSAFRSSMRRYMYFDLHHLSNLVSISGVSFYSFQHCIDDDEVQLCEELGISLFSHIDLYNDFDGLSVELIKMDLMIGISSFPIELAAALGVPVWMLGYSPENYFLRTNGGKSEEDILTLNSTIIAPPKIDFSRPQAEVLRSTLDLVASRLIEMRDKNGCSVRNSS